MQVLNFHNWKKKTLNVNKHNSNIKTSWTHCTVIHDEWKTNKNEIFKKKYFPSIQPNFESNLHHMQCYSSIDSSNYLARQQK